ncbi:hypothetical protein [Nesterenkonia alkaliphila]|uniref:Uncharacterized protein n=1 Tax=Nesterenkonia alkaliphila TaxID=1463631 RepID=A0A7K1UH80_9MICC|nr:hypothetical protein [Nesterenkonia alkaliphila]MVT25818.1 hypothetical protein [Nesterenkonia alkaliphila]GFZ97801.1 hypothetical protein GCM10011359_28840 [Nesterenkonia alkaliphila]
MITGRVRRFVNPVGAYSWDLLAGLQLALEHGCTVTIDDAPYTGEYLHPGVKYRVDISRGDQTNHDVADSPIAHSTPI